MKSTNFFKTIKLIHLALIGGITIFSIVVYVSIESTNFVIPSINDIFVLIVPAVCVFGLVIGNFMYTKLTSSITNEKSLEQRVQQLTSALIVRFALAEGPALLSIVIVLLFENTFYFLFTGIMLVVFAGLKPNREKLGEKLLLTSAEKDQMGL